MLTYNYILIRTGISQILIVLYKQEAKPYSERLTLKTHHYLNRTPTDDWKVFKTWKPNALRFGAKYITLTTIITDNLQEQNV